ncbi:HlyC/CorC family transporter [Calidifontibacter sp. DB0510]|uniref:HlyC/CorC family transporter n=1 Tax=Metallococcus carri TaxID=1656884 RepID=A0A967AYY1_9MICO|nr:hemolysin family protein [Metallococcus carri]NHN54190.1 HlyC/CorC family transporter [Metallococcus carri]NOP36970.1 HlyC/CorC family transporter [Calidifontibacter sp. DB2511S]
MIPLLLAALVAVTVGATLAAVESAFGRVSRHQVEEYTAEGRRGAAALSDLIGDSSAALMVLNFLRVVAEMTAAVLVTVGIGRGVRSLWATLAISIGILAVVSFVIVGVSPRTWGRQHSGGIALATAPVVRWLRDLLGPIAHLLVRLGNAVTPGRGYRDGPFDSEAELREFVDLAGESDLIEADERKMIHSVFELGDTIAREVMVPRTDMITIDRSKTLRQAMSLFNRSGFSRVPVIDGSPDEVEGVLYFKDVAARMAGRTDRGDDPVGEIMREVAFVPDSKPADDLLREMQTDRRHFAIVIDEYGGTAGLVTLEDIVEEVVGEIDDEYDRVSPTAHLLEDGTTRVPARMAVDDFAELFHLNLDEDDVDTVGGLLTKQLGRVPLVGARVEIGDLTLTAERMAGRRHQIATIVVDRWPPQDHDDTAEPVASGTGGRARHTIDGATEGEQQ